MPRYQSLASRLGLGLSDVGGGATALALRDPIRHLAEPGAIARHLVQPASRVMGVLAGMTSPFVAGMKAAEGVVENVNLLLGNMPQMGAVRRDFGLRVSNANNVSAPTVSLARNALTSGSHPVNRARRVAEAAQFVEGERMRLPYGGFYYAPYGRSRYRSWRMRPRRRYFVVGKRYRPRSRKVFKFNPLN